jgi:probable rRNA maturation factor
VTDPKGGRGLAVFVAAEHPSPVDLDQVKAQAELVLGEEGYEHAEVSILFVSDDDIAVWNNRFLQKAGPTDVLSFPVEELTPGSPPPRNGGPPLLLGDVVIAPDYVARQSAEMGVELSDEMALMVTHGLLHLLGYDHQVEAEAEAMEERERHLLGLMGHSRR